MIFVNLTGVITNFANYANKVWFVLQCLLVQSIPGPLATCGISKIVSVNCDLKGHAFQIDFSCSRMQPWRRIRNAKNFNFINVCNKYGKTAQVKHLCNETIHFFPACRKPVGKHIFTANISTISITIELFYHPILVK